MEMAIKDLFNIGWVDRVYQDIFFNENEEFFVKKSLGNAEKVPDEVSFLGKDVANALKAVVMDNSSYQSYKARRLRKITPEKNEVFLVVQCDREGKVLTNAFPSSHNSLLKAKEEAEKSARFNFHCYGVFKLVTIAQPITSIEWGV